MTDVWVRGTPGGYYLVIDDQEIDVPISNNLDADAICKYLKEGYEHLINTDDYAPIEEVYELEGRVQDRDSEISDLESEINELKDKFKKTLDSIIEDLQWERDNL